MKRSIVFLIHQIESELVISLFSEWKKWVNGKTLLPIKISCLNVSVRRNTELYKHDYMRYYSNLGGVDCSRLKVFSFKLLLNQIAVSLGEAFPGPNGFNKTPSSPYLSCCSNLALNSSKPSKASALCRNDDVSNCRWRRSEELWLDAPAVAFWSDEPLLSSSFFLNMLFVIPCQASVHPGLT